MGPAAAATACCRRSTATRQSLGVAARHRRHGDQAAQGQARRLRCRLARAEPECARASSPSRGLTQKRRQDRRVRKLRRDVEGHGQQRRRRRLRHHDHRAGARKPETSPRGIVWPPLPHKRQGRLGSACRRSARSSSRRSRPAAPAISPEKPIELGNYPYPIFVAYASQPADQVYAITKAMIDRLRRLQGWRAGRGRARRQAPDQELGGAGASRRREGPQGSRQLERRPRRPTITALHQAPGRAGRGLGRLQQIQPAIG